MGGEGEMGVIGEMGEAGSVQSSSSASTYVNWGQSDCPGGPSNVVYTGRAVAPTFNNAGGGAQYLCLPDVLDDGGLPLDDSATAMSTLVGVHFETFAASSDFPDSDPSSQEPLHFRDGHVVVCAVCLTQNSAVIMIPNNRDCPVSDTTTTWNMEYTGWLMAARDFINLMPADLEQAPVFGNAEAHFRTEYICVNINPTMLPGATNVDPTSEAKMAHIRIYCNAGLNGLDTVSCIPFFTDFENGDPCDPQDGHCALGPLGCSVCSATTDFSGGPG